MIYPVVPSPSPHFLRAYRKWNEIKETKSEFEVVDIKPLPRVDIGISLVFNTVRVLWIFYRMYSKIFHKSYTAFCLGGWTKTVLYRPNSVKHSHHGQGVQTLNYVTHERSRSTYPAPVPRGRVGGRYVPGGIDAPRGEQVTRMFMDGPFGSKSVILVAY